MSVNVHEAKTHFSKLLTRVVSGEEVVISKSGRPIAKLVPFAKAGADRVPGQDRGAIILRGRSNSMPAPRTL